MHTFAQTNIQLVNQLYRDRYTITELDPILTCYELAMRLFTGRFRASGKTFIAHLVGTASILGSLRVPSNLVAAGLLHAAYATGDFGDGAEGISNTKREQVRAIVGEEVEEYLARYDALPWSDRHIADHYHKIDALSGIDREVLLIRLANELEEYLDLGMLYFGEERRRRTNYLNDNGRLMIEMAEKLGFPALGASLAQAFKETADANFVPALRGPKERNSSFLLAPQSYQRVMDKLTTRLQGAGSTKAGAQNQTEVPK